jgi:hypothetical protein
MRVLKLLCCAVVLTVALAPSARADEWNKKTILTFSGPVQIPGATLPAGSYVFKLADIAGNRHVVQVFDKDEQKIFTTMLAIPNERLEPSDKPVILFSERAGGSPQAVKVWYYPGDRIGNEFVYPKTQAMRIARDTHQPVLAMNNDSTASTAASEVPSSMRSAEVGYFDENGNWQTDDKRVAVSAEPRATTVKPPTSDNTLVTSTATRMTGRANALSDRATGTSGARSPRKHLPGTASDLALFELISGFSLAGGLMLRHLRKRTVAA